jgi:DNA-directed RNA polymerase subunit RPC12/RpoP
MPDYQCPNCSRPVAPDAAFCANCGSRLTLAPRTTEVNPSAPTIAESMAAGVTTGRPWYRRWWGIAGIALAVLLGLGAIGSALGDPQSAAQPSAEASLPFAGAVTPTAAPTPGAEETEAPTPEATVETLPPPPPAKPATYAKPTNRQWAQIVKSPDKYIGKGYQVWACITQFDAATGPDTFRAQASNAKEEYWYSDGDNALFYGDETRLADFVTDDVVVMNVTSLGSFSYDTQVGGNTTVPLFNVDKITRKGSCD